MSVQIRVLAPGDDRGQFSSGNPDLDRFFHRFAGQNQFRHHIGVTYVAVDGTTFLALSPSRRPRSRLTHSRPSVVVDCLGIRCRCFEWRG
jgi:hypothetical protein